MKCPVREFFDGFLKAIVHARGHGTCSQINGTVASTDAMDNCTSTNASCSAGQLRGHAFLAFCVVFAILVIATAVLLIFTLIAVCSASTIARTLRMILVSLLIAVLLAAFAALTELVATIALISLDVQDPSLPVCRFVLWAYAAGSIARSFNTAAFSVAVLLVVRYGIGAVKTARIAIFLVLLWSGAILLNTHLLVPPIYAVQYVDGVACFPRTVDANIIETAHYTFIAVWVLLGGVAPVLVSIVVPILVLCHIRRNCVSKGSNYNVRLAKFALFLLSGSFINILGQAVLHTVFHFSDAKAVYVAFAISSFSLLPTPLLIIAYLKQVRQRMRAMLATSCLCCRYYKPTKERKLLGATSITFCETLEQPCVYTAFHDQG